MFPYLFGLIAAPLAAWILWGLLGSRRSRGSSGAPLDLVFCTSCSSTQPALRWPTSLAASDPGGWSCSSCGAELEVWDQA